MRSILSLSLSLLIAGCAPSAPLGITRVVDPVDPAWNLPEVFSQYTNGFGVPVLASTGVHRDALLRADGVIGLLLSANPEHRTLLMEAGASVVIYADNEDIRDMPGYDGPLDGTLPLARFAAETNTLIVPASNMLCLTEQDRQVGDLLVHEWAHLVDAVVVQPTQDEASLAVAYEDAMGRGLWNGLYAATDPAEYLAEGLTAWFGVMGTARRPMEPWASRADLAAYDDALYSEIAKRFERSDLYASCHWR